LVGSITKEFPLDQVDRTIRLVGGGIRYAELRRRARLETHGDIPALVANRFLLERDGVIVRDRFLSLAENEQIQAPRLRKIMYLTWAFRDYRIRRFVLERICDANGRWQASEVTRKSNAQFFTEFFATRTTTKVRSNFEFFFVTIINS
jgi:hypothetical protein